MDNRFATLIPRQTHILMQKPPVSNLLVTVRVLADNNVQGDEVVTGIGKGTKDSTFTIKRGEFVVGRGIRGCQFTFLGTLADKAVEQGIKVGTVLRIDGLPHGRVNAFGNDFERKPVVYVDWFEIVSQPEPKSGMAHIDDKGGIEPLPGEKLQKVGE